MALQALKKITSRDVMQGKPEMHTVEMQVPNANDPTKTETKKVTVAKPADLYVFYGRAVNHRTGETALGPFVEYIGSFEARRLSDGEVFQSTRMIPPPIASDLLDQAYMNAKKDDPNAEIDLGFIIGVQPDFSGALGYKYTCKPLQAGGAAKHDPLEQLRQSMGPQITAALGADKMLAIGMTPTNSDGEVLDGTKAEGEAAPAAEAKPKAKETA